MPIRSGRVGGVGVKVTPGLKEPHLGLPFRSLSNQLTPVAGVVPVWSVDWTTQSSIPAELTVARSTTGTYFDSSGLISTAAINAARVEYNPTTRALAGLLLEGSATNLTTKSNSFLNDGNPWNYVNAAMSQNATGPDGVANSAWTLTAAANARTLFYAGIGTADYAILSIFVKAGASGFVVLGIGDATGANTFQSWFNPSTGAWTNTNVQIAGSTHNVTLDNHFVQLLPNGFYRISFKASNPGSSFNAFSYGLSTNDTVDTATTSDSVIVYGSQFEQATAGQTEPTSYIPTTGVAVTRGGDVIGSTNAGLLAAKAWVIETSDIDNGTDAVTTLGINTINGLGKSSGKTLITADGGTLSGNAAVWNGNNRSVIAWDSTPRVSIDLNGGSVVTAANTPATPTALYFGSLNNGAGNFINGHIRMMAAYTALSDYQETLISPVGASFIIGTGVVSISAIAAETVADFTSTGTSTIAISGSANQTLAAFTSVGAEALKVLAAANETVASFTQTATATVIISASASNTLAAFTTVSADVLKIAASANETVANFTSSATATLSIAATANQTLAAFTSAGAAQLKILATANQTLAGFTSASAAQLIERAAANETVADFTSAAATVLKLVATSSITVDPMVSLASTQVIVKATANQTVTDFTSVSTATFSKTAIANQLLDDFTQSATSVLRIVAQSNINLDPFTLSAIGALDEPIDRDIQKPFIIYPDRRRARPYLVRG